MTRLSKRSAGMVWSRSRRLVGGLLVDLLDLGIDAAGLMPGQVEDATADAFELRVVLFGLGVETRTHGGFRREAGGRDEVLVQGAAGDVGVVERLAGGG